MRRFWFVVLGLACAGWALDAYWWSQVRASWHPPAAVPPALPELAGLPPISANPARQALARPLLWSSRRPVPAAAQAGTAGAGQELGQARLMAVLESGTRRIALLRRPDGSLLGIGTEASPGPWRLERFDGHVAVFVGADGARVERPLERAEAPAASPRAPAAAPAPRPPARAADAPPAPHAPAARPDGGTPR